MEVNIMSKSINKKFRSTVNAGTVGLFSYSPNCKLQQHAIHDIRMRFTPNGNKYANILDHMIKTGKAKSGKTMRQVYKYLYTWMLDTGVTRFDCPKFNANCKYTIILGDDGELYITNVTRDKQFPKSINEMMLEEERHRKWEEE